MAQESIRDRMWLWCHPAGSHHRPGNPWNLPGHSVIAPAEAAAYMGLENAIMVRFGNDPAPPFDAAAAPLRGMKRVIWSVIGDGSSTSNNAKSDVEAVLALASKMPNLTGAIMDDFFRRDVADPARLSLAQLAEVRGQLRSARRPLDLYCVLYKHEMDLPVAAYLEHVDAVTYWTWRADELVNLERDFAGLERLLPRHRKLLGLYMWDYGDSRPMPMDAMKHQCELALRWLRAGRVEGIIFLASCIVDVGIEAVDYCRRFIAEVGGIRLAP